MCGSMVEIQSATAEIRRGKKQKKKKKQDENIMSASAAQGGHNKGCEQHALVFLSYHWHSRHWLSPCL